ncbi:PulJ/GspJ family protein [Costertonia aggregata]|uniref:Prepilin-type N-terminal cleavage/methylation domain-containing protein n=1 Tax=Costertonia aggregata TaxID=343403 RepID=A0A7H9ATL6_9FLAO|nr:hypothetical protein [Costertonia aggregata]QLG46789.1 hypothetical protein HYG79_16000 [Costertonia aggregata]
MKATRFKAFTLSEMVIALVITVIVVGLAFTILGLVQKQMWAIESNYEQGTETNLLRQALWIDFNRYSEFNFDRISNRLQGSNPLEKVIYTFETDFVLREKDTFHVRLAEKKFYFDGKSISSGSIDAIELLTGKEQGSKRIFVYKHNASADYMR